MNQQEIPSRMFRSITRTWNPAIGCKHDCTYCWARDIALGRLRNTAKYTNGFSPRFFPDELSKKFKLGEFIGVSLMGDLFGEWVPGKWIEEVLKVIHRFPKTNFLLQTKNPGRFFDFEPFPINTYLGTTIETNRDYNLSKAPAPSLRAANLLMIQHPHKFVSIEPIMDFDLDIIVQWMTIIKPDIIEIGADNHRKNLSEPMGLDVDDLIRRLKDKDLNVIEKPGLERLCLINPGKPTKDAPLKD